MKTIDRRSLLGCGLVLVGAPAAAQEGSKPVADDLTNAPNPEQVRGFLKSVERSGDEELQRAVFGRLGRECLYSRKLDEWALQFRGKVESLAERVNSGRSRYWENLEYDKAAGTLRVTSRKYPHCVCAWAQCEQPPKLLCRHCCRAFHTEIWGLIFDRKVEVEVTESLLLGGERCRTTVRIPPA